MEAFDREGIGLWHQLRKKRSPDYEAGYFSEKLSEHFINPHEMELLTSSLLMKTTVSEEAIALHPLSRDRSFAQEKKPGFSNNFCLSTQIL